MALATAQVQYDRNHALAFGKNLITIGLIAELPAVIASAVADAIGKPFRKIPVTLEDVLAALDDADT